MFSRAGAIHTGTKIGNSVALNRVSEEPVACKTEGRFPITTYDPSFADFLNAWRFKNANMNLRSQGFHWSELRAPPRQIHYRKSPKRQPKTYRNIAARR